MKSKLHPGIAGHGEWSRTLPLGKAISDVLLQLYAPPEEGDFNLHVLGVLEACVPATMAGYSTTLVKERVFEQKAIRNLQGGATPGLDELNAAFPLHPFFEYYCSNNFAPLICTTDIMSEEEWVRTPLYNEVYRPYGVVHDASLRFYSAGHCHSFMFSGSVPLDMATRRLLNHIAPHLANAHRICRIQHRERCGNLPDNMIKLTFEGRLFDCPDGAARLLGQYYPAEQGVSIWGLPEAVERWVRHEIRSHGSTHWTFSENKLLVRHETCALSIGLLQHAGGYIILLEESKAARPLHILIGLGLTIRETEVLMWVAQGKQNSEVAAILGISAATVRKHMGGYEFLAQAQRDVTAESVAGRLRSIESQEAES